MSRAFTKERDDAPQPEPVLRKRVEELPARPDDLRVVGPGAHVVVEGVDAEPRTFTIAGYDETDLAAQRIGIDSPLAQALLGKRAGNRVVWHRPAGDRTLRIARVEYD
ncbi:hypothetical protein WPS_25960 [Vulcanimicrobium alpinum]|uniref:Transcription elongation factor GreA/GreB C-terminal domain-containing protein n=1 Tax=Vulcanimicrobium alpinum TaxID=3016050 RepID=A0AAN2CA62_UNVUL|nr:GreA/GreB family elongation factor [Vulcanimicrobium alpinum]BDE07320.1 hypothetical protein WPS_25960 [Vulcanimicrobium alpinum]